MTVCVVYPRKVLPSMRTGWGGMKVGEGSRRRGGRWNRFVCKRKGKIFIKIILKCVLFYTSTSIEL